MFCVLFLHQPGVFLRIYNLRAIPGSSKVPGLTSSQSEEVDHLAFHLHGGTTYGRGIRILPENSPDVQELKRYSRRRGTNICAKIEANNVLKTCIVLQTELWFCFHVLSCWSLDQSF